MITLGSTDYIDIPLRGHEKYSMSSSHTHLSLSVIYVNLGIILLKLLMLNNELNTAILLEVNALEASACTHLFELHVCRIYIELEVAAGTLRKCRLFGCPSATCGDERRLNFVAMQAPQLASSDSWLTLDYHLSLLSHPLLCLVSAYLKLLGVWECL